VNNSGFILQNTHSKNEKFGPVCNEDTGEKVGI
jgi:hypothetical protein